VGYLREKYTRAYYLHRDQEGRPFAHGVDGIAEFLAGGIRAIDRDVLERVCFSGLRVLDIGCGRGEAIKYVMEHGAASAVGIDFSPDAIQIAQEFLRQRGVRAELLCIDALEYAKQVRDRGSESFDVVLMFDCVEHIPRSELTELLVALRPALSPRALLLVSTPAFARDCDVLSDGLKELDHSDMQEGTEGMHCNRYTKRSLKRYLARFGFAAVSHHVFAFNLRLGVRRAASPGARWLAFRAGYPISIPRALDPEWYEGATWKAHPLLAPVRWAWRGVRVLYPFRKSGS
jgi:2-polyprenyl-3-methyl-5-hydroxy-6-metoxy-1,4-benzoquinol methylase